jgi:DNA-binding beta-propeller fold protein YncE
MTHARLAIALVAGLLLAGACGGGSHHTSSTRTARTSVAAHKRAVHAVKVDPVLARLGLPPLRGHSPLPGYLMIADRDNDRIIIVTPSKKIVWRFPTPGALKPGQKFAGPDDAFITQDGRYITTNEEFSDTVAVLSLARNPRIVWQYGHQDVQGSGPGFLAHPDDAYMVAHGQQLMVADIINCRVLWVNHARRVVHAIGSAGDCAHAPPHALLQPNGDTPLPDGGVVVTEIGGWVDRFSATGKLKWSIKTPTNYPSDAQLLPNGNVLVAGFNSPGRIDIITPRGRILWTYGPASGPGALDQPSLAVQLPNGMIAATDDWNHRVVLIDPKRKRIVWQYGHDHQAGTARGYLNKPDGLDLVP